MKIEWLLLAMLCVGVPVRSGAEEEPRNVETTCNRGKLYQAGLCYERCKEDFTGVGPVCWADCPDGYKDDGALCRKAAIIIPKDSYGRGAGSVFGCGDNQEQDGGLCYPKCKSGYNGVGPVCWQKCPDGYKDDGALCRRDAKIKSADTSRCSALDKCGLTFDKGCSRCPSGYKNDGCTCRRDVHIFAKSSHGRGAGSPIHTCGDDEEKDGALCYPKCKASYHGVGPVCWQKCPDGYKDDGALCSKDPHIIPKDSYGRGAGTVPPTCATPSFTKTVPPVSDLNAFTMIIASDPQLPWWEDSPPCDGDEDCTKRNSKRANRDQVRAMNDIQRASNPLQPGAPGAWPSRPDIQGGGAPIQKPLGVIINGDLTAFWQDWQVELFERYYTLPGTLRWPLFVGLGNHDYANNLGDGWWREPLYYLTLGENGAAANARDFIKTMIHCDKVPNFPASLIQSFDKQSLAYSWNQGSYHFVQLHNYPTYSAKAIDVSPSIDWLKKDLAAATAAGRKIVLNLHDYGDHMKQDDPAFLKAIANQNVVAVFAGHIHERHGFRTQVPGTNIPVFLSGSSDMHTFLLVQFTDTYLTVGVINSEDGKTEFLDPADAKNLMTVPVPASATSPKR
ncbi:metallophosphoesterase [Corallococcus interemptor]|uniref:metallophosphoesterase n=1 Tax=Corallococcus interemptor TaxID=2316720 RepID=UPI0035D3F32D